MPENAALPEKAREFREVFSRLRQEVGRVITGQHAIVDGVLTCMFVGGNCLLEGVPGLGKTMLVRTLATVLDLEFSRVQFTPDLMPADIIGTQIIREDEHGNRALVFQPGPIFAQIVLADEINRATPKTQSAVEPMTADEAISQMEMLGHTFFVFLNEQTNTVCVVYAREDGNFGLLIPER